MSVIPEISATEISGVPDDMKKLMDVFNLKQFLQKNNQPSFRLKQIAKAVYQDGVSSFLEITALPEDLRETLDGKMKILPFVVEKVLESENNDSAKALLKLVDGQLIETVLISPKPCMWSACISSQAGCPLGCRFCATGKMGFKRNLTAEEITGQVLFWRQYLKKSQISNLKSQKVGSWDLEIGNYDVSNVVYMGMGEPFLNWENVGESLKMLMDKNFFGFGARSISVSTAGVPEGIEKFGREFPQVNLALSLHFADDKKRGEFMPVNKKFDIGKLRNSLRSYFQNTNRQIFVEYVLLDGINDGRDDALKLSRFLKSVAKLQLIHVNLIRYNMTSGEFKPSSKEHAYAFKNFLLEQGISATIRKSLGSEIQGACGQLAGN